MTVGYRLDHDILLTHSAPALMRELLDDTDPKKTFLEPGQIIIWRWLAIDRFFPPRSGDETRQSVLRGCASVSWLYKCMLNAHMHVNRIIKRVVCSSARVSVTLNAIFLASFKIISSFSFPDTNTQYVTPNLHVYQTPIHDPVVLFTYPNSTLISMFNVIHLQPRKPPPFPLESEGDHLAETTQKMYLGDQRALVDIFRWEIKTVSSNVSALTDESPEMLMTCAMGNGGQTIVAVGVRGSIWIWNERRTLK